MSLADNLAGFKQALTRQDPNKPLSTEQAIVILNLLEQVTSNIPGTPDFQAVTDAGATTSANITVAGVTFEAGGSLEGISLEADSPVSPTNVIVLATNIGAIRFQGSVG